MNPEEWRTAQAHIREIIDIELKHRDRALENQAREYERRLEILNHENQRILAAGTLVQSHQFVPLLLGQ